MARTFTPGRGAGSRTFFTLALLCALAGPAAAQYTNCPPVGSTLAGSPMYLQLGSGMSIADNDCVSTTSEQESITRGSRLGGCYRSNEFGVGGVRLMGNVICTVCMAGDPGCYAPLPPDPSLFPTDRPFYPPPPPDWPGSSPTDPFKDLGDPPPMNIRYFNYGYDFEYWGYAW
jgi:hypothetical protein